METRTKDLMRILLFRGRAREKGPWRRRTQKGECKDRTCEIRAAEPMVYCSNEILKFLRNPLKKNAMQRVFGLLEAAEVFLV